MSDILVTLGSLVIIAAIIWWFWLSSPTATHAVATQIIDILVQDGAYQPAVIEVSAGKELTFQFVRHDPAPCAEKVVFGDLGISADLPLGKPQVIKIGPLPPGTHEFTCQMGMYRGKLVAA